MWCIIKCTCTCGRKLWQPFKTIDRIVSVSAALVTFRNTCSGKPSEMGKAQIPLGSSRHDSTRSTCRASRARRVECVAPCCWTSSTQPKCMGRVEQVESCRDVTWRAKWNLGLNTTARSVVFFTASTILYQLTKFIWRPMCCSARKVCACT